MKKYSLIIAVATCFINKTHTMENKKTYKQELPVVAALKEIDAKEFIQECNNQKISLTQQLQIHCSKLHDGRIVSDSIADATLLKFAQDMAAYEKEWKKWHTYKGILPMTTQSKNLAIPLPKEERNSYLEKIFTHGKFKINDQENRKNFTIREDSNSPYYQLTHSGLYDINIMEWIENEVYHNELQFLQTQVCKMDLYLNIEPNPNPEQNTHYANSIKARDLLKEEIELFKKNRISFTHSCLKSTDFEKIQAQRNAINTEKIWNDLPWYTKIYYNWYTKVYPDWNPSHLNPDVKTFAGLQQKHQLARDRKQNLRE